MPDRLRERRVPHRRRHSPSCSPGCPDGVNSPASSTAATRAPILASPHRSATRERAGDRAGASCRRHPRCCGAREFRATSAAPRTRGCSGDDAQRDFRRVPGHEVAWETNGHGDFTVRASRVLAAGIDGMTNQQFQTVCCGFGRGRAESPARLRGYWARVRVVATLAGASSAPAAAAGSRTTGGADGAAAVRLEASSGILMSTPGEAAPTQAAAAQAQSRGRRRPTVETAGRRQPRLGRDYTIGDGLIRLPDRAVRARGGGSGLPAATDLRAWIRPCQTRRRGRARSSPLRAARAGPGRRLLRGRELDDEQNVRYRRADLENHGVLYARRLRALAGRPRFHQQMVYAVCSNVYAAFRAALGRHLALGLRRRSSRSRLRIRPHARHEANAYYDEPTASCASATSSAGPRSPAATCPGGYVFTCLSHDIVAHEMTHALLDGLRAHFTVADRSRRARLPRGVRRPRRDLPALQLQGRGAAAIRRSRRRPREAARADRLARQFGHTTGLGSTRCAAPSTRPAPAATPTALRRDLSRISRARCSWPRCSRPSSPSSTQDRARYIRLATNGTGVLPPGELPADLQDCWPRRRAGSRASSSRSVSARSTTARRSDIDVRRVPARAHHRRSRPRAGRPVGLPRGADRRVPRRRIYPRDVTSLSEDALLWRPTRVRLTPDRGLSFAKLRFEGDPGAARRAPTNCGGRPASLGDYVTRPAASARVRARRARRPSLDGDGRACRASSRSAPRGASGPDGQVVFDLVAEVTQTPVVVRRTGAGKFDYYGGCTVILGPYGEIRFVILKSVVGAGRLERRRDYIEKLGHRFWQDDENGVRVPRPGLFRMTHSDE